MALSLIFGADGGRNVWVIMFLGVRGLLPNASYKENINSDKGESHSLYSMHLSHLPESSHYLLKISQKMGFDEWRWLDRDYLVATSIYINIHQFPLLFKDNIQTSKMGKTRSSSASNNPSSQKTDSKMKVMIDDTLYTESDMSLSMDNSIYSNKNTPFARIGKEQETSKEENSEQLNTPQDEIETKFDRQAQEQNVGQSKIQENGQNQQQQQHEQNSFLSELSQPDRSHFLNQVSARADLSLLSTQQDNEQDYNLIDSQSLQKQMKEIDDWVRSLSIKKNRLKYLLRKKEGLQLDGQQQPMPIKRCKCCGKDISKLCFRCEHLYCKAEQCARKKKQILNARMLRKLKESKQTGNKKAQLKGKKQRKGMKKELPQVLEESSIESDYSSSQHSSDSQIPDTNLVNNPHPFKKQEQQQQSSVDISTSSFFTFTSQKSNIFFDPDEE